MRQHTDRLQANNIEVLIVTFELEEHALNYKQDTELEWPLIVDTSRELYHYYGMAQASFWDIWGPASFRVYLREILKGNLPKPAKDDIHQRGGDVLISPEGMVRLHHICKGPADRPEIEEIIQIVEQDQPGVGLQDDLHQLKN